MKRIILIAAAALVSFAASAQDFKFGYVDFTEIEPTITIPDDATYIRMSYLNNGKIQPSHVAIVKSGGDLSASMLGIQICGVQTGHLLLRPLGCLSAFCYLELI